MKKATMTEKVRVKDWLLKHKGERLEAGKVCHELWSDLETEITNCWWPKERKKLSAKLRAHEIQVIYAFNQLFLSGQAVGVFPIRGGYGEGCIHFEGFEALKAYYVSVMVAPLAKQKQWLLDYESEHGERHLLGTMRYLNDLEWLDSMRQSEILVRKDNPDLCKCYSGSAAMFVVGALHASVFPKVVIIREQ